MRLLMPWKRRSPTKASRWRNTTQFWKWRRTIPMFAKKFVSASVLRPNSYSSRPEMAVISALLGPPEARIDHTGDRRCR
jgi:hypothetical protein